MFFIYCLILLAILVGPAIITGFLVGRRRARAETGCAIGCGVGIVTFAATIVIAFTPWFIGVIVNSSTSVAIVSIVLICTFMIAVSTSLTAIMASQFK
jgi:hypothetical protein